MSEVVAGLGVHVLNGLIVGISRVQLGVRFVQIGFRFAEPILDFPNDKSDVLDVFFTSFCLCQQLSSDMLFPKKIPKNLAFPPAPGFIPNPFKIIGSASRNGVDFAETGCYVLRGL